MTRSAIAEATRALRSFARFAPVLLLHWTVGAALTLAARPAVFELAARACPFVAMAWLAPILTPRALLSRHRVAARRLDIASGAMLALLVVIASATWLARGAGWPSFLSPFDFGERWARLFSR
ncbi:MAG: hypothetical protein ABJE95_01340 [Byssovorax sp.]